MRNLTMLASSAWLLVTIPGTIMADADTTERARAFIRKYDKEIRPLEITAATGWWQASVTGKDEDFARKQQAQDRLDAALGNKEMFAELKELKQARGQGKIDDTLAARAIDVLYLSYLEKQVDPELLRKMSTLENAIEQKFNVYRAEVAGEKLADSEVRRILKTGTNSIRREAVWTASKGVGAAVETELKQLVQLRNETARQLGFANYHDMKLQLNEQNGDELITLFDELDELTREPFARAKADIDARLAKNYGIAVADLRPWHYHDPFFQESPTVFDVDIDAPYAKADILKLCRDFYEGVGLSIDAVLARSDLYEKEGKSPHAFCTDIDREGDVRVLANIVPNEYWMGTMLHELGHAVYSSKNIPASVPYVLREASHILTTEGVAMQFERFSKSRLWLEQMGVTLDNPEEFEKTARKVQQNQLLIFSRWCQVMLRFEKAMYENPDQDLNKLWWDMVEKYQLLKRPEGRDAPDYASKIHVVVAPVYYHNYMMGQLFASQVHHTICRELYDRADPAAVTYVGDRKVGEFMRQRVFAPGRAFDWRGLTVFATGEPLNAKAFAADFQE